MKYLGLILVFIFTGCVPNTYYSTTDDYVVGLRWWDRGEFDKAIYYWEPLIKKGDCDAENMMANAYMMGRGVEASEKKAISLLKKAASGNQQKAQMTLGDFYYQNNSKTAYYCKNCSIKKDKMQALTWYLLAEQSAKYSGEKKYLDYIIPIIKKDMTNEQISQAEDNVSKWEPKPKDCNARDLW